MPWIRRKLHGSLVHVRTDAAGVPAAGADGRVDIAYKPRSDAKIYRAAVRNLQPTGDADDDVPRDLTIGEQPGDEAASAAPPQGEPRPEAAGGGRGGPARRAPRAAAAGPRPARTVPAPAGEDAIVIYTDGACTGNPGPAGIGAVILDHGERRELSEYLGLGTNNVAELTAILRALEDVPGDARQRPIIVHSDSSYAIGLLTRSWKAKANADLVGRLRSLAAEFPRLVFVKVKGHAGVPENERADELARVAVERRR